MHKVALRIALLACGLALFVNPAKGQQEPTATAGLLETVMEYRVFWMGDSTTTFIACQVYERSGRPDGFPESFSVAARRLLDRQTDSCEPQPDLPVSRISIHSVAAGDSSAQVSLFVLNGEKRHREDYTLLRAGHSRWFVAEVRRYSHMHFVGPRPAPSSVPSSPR